MGKPLFTALLLVAFCTTAMPALPQSAQDRATARQLAGDAEKKLATKEYDAAYELFAKAYALVPAPTLQVAMGRTKLALGQLIEAQELLLEAARSTPQPGEPASWAPARREGEKEGGALSSRIPMIDITLEGATEPTPGTSIRVFVDKEEVKGVALRGIPRAVNPGNHVVRAEGDAYKPAEVAFKITESERKRIALKLEPLARGSEAGAATGPGAVAPPAAAAAPGRTSSPSSATATAAVHSPTSGGIWNGYTITGLAVLGATLGTGAITGIVSLSQVNDIKSSCTPLCPSNRQDDADKAKTLGTISTVAFGLSAVGVGLLTYGVLKTNPPPTATKSSQLQLNVGLGGATFEGRF